MAAAVLDRTRAYFHVSGGYSLISALLTGRDVDVRNQAVGQSSREPPRKRPTKRMTLLASAVLAPAVMGIVVDPWRPSPDQSALAEHEPPSVSSTMTIDCSAHTVPSKAFLPVTFCESSVIPATGTSNFVSGAYFAVVDGQDLIDLQKISLRM